MDRDTEIFEEIERVFDEAERACDEASYSEESVAALRQLIDDWTSRREFLEDIEENAMLRCWTLNRITFLLSNEVLFGFAWQILTELAEQTDDADQNAMRESMRISTYESFVEWPENPAGLELLFSLETNPRARWAVFEAHHFWPGKFRRNIERFSKGGITHEDYLAWLETKGLQLTPRGIRRIRPRQ